MDEVKKLRNLEVRELGELVMWIVICLYMVEKIVGYVLKFNILRRGRE